LKTISEIISENIIARRESLKMSQTALAKAVGLSLQSIYKLEAGRTQARKSNLVLIAKALKCDVEDLYVDRFAQAGPPSPTAASMAEVIAAQQAEIEGLKTELQNLKSDPIWIACEKASPGTREQVLTLMRLASSPGEVDKVLARLVQSQSQAASKASSDDS
jgi:DNA-binding XRE family transcriptional regulator